MATICTSNTCEEGEMTIPCNGTTGCITPPNCSCANGTKPGYQWVAPCNLECLPCCPDPKPDKPTPERCGSQGAWDAFNCAWTLIPPPQCPAGYSLDDNCYCKPGSGSGSGSGSGQPSIGGSGSVMYACLSDDMLLWAHDRKNFTVPSGYTGSYNICMATYANDQFGSGMPAIYYPLGECDCSCFVNCHSWSDVVVYGCCDSCQTNQIVHQYGAAPSGATSVPWTGPTCWPSECSGCHSLEPSIDY